MLVRIIVILFACALLVFGVLWIMSGGLSQAIEYAKTISNPIELFTGTASGTPFALPGQPDLISGPEIGVAGSDLENAIYDTNLGGAGDTSLQHLDPQTYGNPSTAVGSISLSLGSAAATRSSEEYLVISANDGNTAPISLSGWSLQSAHTGIRYPLPPAAPLFAQGIVNSVKPVALEPGSSAIVTTGTSPIGVSFRENRCSGYLAQFQTFTPALQARCPYPSDALADTPETRAQYGDSCFAFLYSIPLCTFPRTAPADVSPACMAAVSNALSYNTCVNSRQLERGFYGNVWRLYLNIAQPIWREHDVIRLLDQGGRTVDVLSY